MTPKAKMTVAVGLAAALSAAAFAGILWGLGRRDGGCQAAAPDTVYVAACKEAGGTIDVKGCAYHCSVEVSETALIAVARTLLAGVDACAADGDCAVDVCVLGQCGFAFNKERWAVLEDARRHLGEDACEAMECGGGGGVKCVDGRCRTLPEGP